MVATLAAVNLAGPAVVAPVGPVAMTLVPSFLVGETLAAVGLTPLAAVVDPPIRTILLVKLRPRTRWEWSLGLFQASGAHL
ncbi:MAG: hypothetical protein LBR11_12135 [Deltaproteobacteria bacterium]|nr:hypothetical protein [Deltaproteobacteria bacterium]